MNRLTSSPSRRRLLRPSVRLFLGVALSFSLGSAALFACDGPTLYLWVCVDAEGNHVSGITQVEVCPCGCCLGPDASFWPGCDLVDGGADGDASAEGDADADAPLEAPGCSGTCVPAKLDGWDDPQLLAIGTPLAMPSCPSVAPAIIYEGYAGLDMSPASCPTCSCAPPAGSCGLPATVTASTSAACPDDGPGAVLTPFDPPSGWDGGCTSEGAIPSGASCVAGPCIRSLTIAPLTLQESGCTSTATSGSTIPDVSWSTYAVACIGSAAGVCAKKGDFCAALALVDGFLECIFHDGDVACPSYGAYFERHVFYASADDTRSCSACACGSAAGSTCSAEVSVYTDSACSSLLFADAITSSVTSCIDVPTGSMLGSKSASPATYTAGACSPSGGEPTGSVAPTMPSTFCCLPSR